ncbi:MAG TPA: M23 family metallopeptidase [Gammaproteobacteria bacterium]|nr:M23 family metallopeptidase [Gammaproteobacteria bacterium]
MRYFKLFILLCIAMAEGRVAVAVALPQNSSSPGGIAVVAVDATQTSYQFGRRQVMTISKGQQRWAIVGLSLDITPGQYILSPRPSGQVAATPFTVVPHRFGYFQVGSAGAVSGTAQIASKADPKALQIALSLPRSKLPTLRPLFPFQAPVAGSVVLPFGTWLYLNSDAGYQIKGMKYLADTPRVSSPGDGVIYSTIIRKDGMSVIIDHGKGLISVLYPLEPIAIKPLQRVRRGQVLGRTMKRKSGAARLNWMTLLNGNWVNPSLLLLPR